MENISISYNTQEKEDQQTITIVDASNLSEVAQLEDSALIHHVLEVPMSNGDENSIYKSKYPYCLVCNAKLNVSKRGAINIFSKEVRSPFRQLHLDFLLGSILNCELESSSTHSEIICRKCYKLVEDFDELASQMYKIKEDLTDKYIVTKLLLSNGGPINYTEDNDTQILSNGNIHTKVLSSKGRLKKKKRSGKFDHFPTQFEVKQEPLDMPSINLESCDGLQDDTISLMNSVCDDYSSEEMCGDGSTELDGLDVDYDDGTLHFDGMDVEDGNNGIKNSLLLQMQSYKCRFCKMKSSFAEVQKHLVEVHADRLYECEVCSDRLSSRIELMQHINDHLATGQKPFSCTLCNLSYALPRQLKEHIKKHTENLPCYHCGIRLPTARALQEHINIHNGNRRSFRCEQCGKKFASRNILKAHAKIHGLRTRSHKCKKCDKLFYTFHHLQEHMRVHQSRKDHVCEFCGKAFSSSRSLDSHSMTHTGIKNFTCRICQKAFLRKGEVDDHERIHTGEKPFQCEYCGAVFSQRSNLLSHKKATHFQQKNYSCPDCDRAFKRRRLLKYHRQSVHTGERPFKCSYCKASFVYPEHYKKHLRIHTGEKPFKCEICNKAFNSKDNKNAHKFIHSDKKQYECLICGAGYMRKPQLTSHIKQHGHIDDVGDFIKINPSTVVDDEHLGVFRTRNFSLVDAGLDKDAESVFSRAMHIEANIPKIILPADMKSEDEDVHFLTTLEGQMVELGQIVQISQVDDANISAVGQLSSVSGEYSPFEIVADPDSLTMAVSST